MIDVCATVPVAEEQLFLEGFNLMYLLWVMFFFSNWHEFVILQTN